MELKNTYGVINNTGSVLSEHYLLCPKCGEHLRPSDVENFSSCPFCNYKFKEDDKFEAFILEPVIETWVRQQGISAPEHSTIS